MALNSEDQRPVIRQGPRVLTGSIWLILVVAIIVLVVLAIGYFTVISVFGVPWYAAIPLSLVAGAGILVFEFGSSWKAWLLAAVLVAVAGVAAFGWWFTDAMR
jgi:hypothetical protein